MWRAPSLCRLSAGHRNRSLERSTLCLLPFGLDCSHWGCCSWVQGSPADAAYGEVANVFRKPKTNTAFLPYNGEGFKLNIPSNWNQSKGFEYSGQVLRYEDNFNSRIKIFDGIAVEKKSFYNAQDLLYYNFYQNKQQTAYYLKVQCKHSKQSKRRQKL